MNHLTRLTIPIKTQRFILQCLVALGACVPVAAGGWGMLTGAAMLGEHAGGQAGQHAADVALDSHVRYLSGLLFGIGIAFWNMVPWIERAAKYARLLALIVFIGGLARLYAAIFIAWPPLPMQLALVMELVVTPLLYLWQRHIAKYYV